MPSENSINHINVLYEIENFIRDNTFFFGCYWVADSRRQLDGGNSLHPFQRVDLRLNIKRLFEPQKKSPKDYDQAENVHLF